MNQFPDVLKLSSLVLVQKKLDLTEQTSYTYRPVSILRLLSKVFEKLIYFHFTFSVNRCVASVNFIHVEYCINGKRSSTPHIFLERV